MNTYYISVGSNLGDRQCFIDNAYAELLAHQEIAHIESAPVIETEPWGYTEQGAFLNTVWRITTHLDPFSVLHILQSLEKKSNRQRHIHWGPRTLDLDIIYGIDSWGAEIIIEDEELTIPHLYFWNRLFVLVPLQGIEPGFTFKGEHIEERIQYLVRHPEQ